MRYYAHYGHRDFILCLGYRADAIKDYFLHYDEARVQRLRAQPAGARWSSCGTDIADWRITFADTGPGRHIGERLLRVRHHLAGEDMFLANYGDCLTDAPLDQLIEQFKASGRVGAFISVPATGYPFHLVEFGDGRPGDRRRATRSMRACGSTAATSSSARRSSTTSSRARSWSRSRSGG